MDSKIIEWTDPISGEKLIEKGKYLISNRSRYPIIYGIPVFVNELNDENQTQVQKSFEDKWTTSSFGQDDKEFEEKIKPVFMNMMGIESDLSIFKNKIILDVGIGSGSTARLWATHAKEFHGIDISKAIFKARNALKSLSKPPILSQADLNNLPYPDNSFDIIVSNGVFHHTPNTKEALGNTIKKLKKGGDCIFYIYKKKSPIREFTDDFIRSQISDLEYSEAWEKVKPLTEFGKLLHQKDIKIDISHDIELLGIKKGTYDLQRFIYNFIFKCFWNDSWGYEYSNLVNVDWFHPKYCWRHTEDEIRSWCQQFNLKIRHIKEKESGYACWLIKE